MEFSESLYLGNLFAIYKNLLTEKQRNVCELIYNADLGLSEVAEKFNLSRQAIMDTLTKANNQLKNFEKALSQYEKQKMITELLNKSKDEKLREEIMKIIES